MAKRRWQEVKVLTDEEVKAEFAILAQEVEQLSKHVGTITNAEDEDAFVKEVSDCIDSLHGLRTRVQCRYLGIL
ncbi:hypothetical protein [Phage f2b1]|nr:hypothetical protein [Phage f2b1]